MKFSYEWIKELSGVSLSPQEAAEMLTAKAFEVKDIIAVNGDTVLDIDILPNRPDALSHLGIARELAALANRRFAAPQYEYGVSDHPPVSVQIKDSVACPRYSALIVREVKVGPSPQWLRNRLEACGLKSINNVVDVTNYVMLELGQPMHAFDMNLVDRIVVRPATAGERLTALDEARTGYILDESMLVIADSTKPIAIAGIKGGVGTGISDTTTDMLLEAANFEPQSIRATSRKLNLRTDASVRFSYGVDPNLTAPALMRAAQLLVKVAAASPDRTIIDAYPVSYLPRTLALDPPYACALLGVQVADAQIRGILESLGFEVSDEDREMNVTVPTRRLDVQAAEDLIEEVGRIYGYDAIPAAAPVLPIYDEHAWVNADTQVAWDEYPFIRERSAIIHMLVGAGYSEVYNYSFLSEELQQLLKPDGSHELALPPSSEYHWLRTSLVPRLLVNVRDNLRFSDRVRILEVGHVFDHIGQGKESNRLALALAGKESDDTVFYELKGALSLLIERLGIDDVSYDDTEPFPWDAGAVHATTAGRRAVLRTDGGVVLGFIGVVQQSIATGLKLKAPAAVAELDLRMLVELAQREREFEPLPKYPAVVRDIAMLVDADTKIDDILQAIQGADTGGLVRDVDVFDIFVPTGKEKLKSVAVHIIYRSDSHTLTDKEVEKAESAIKAALQENLNAQIR